MYFFDTLPTHMVRPGDYCCYTVSVRHIHFIFTEYTQFEIVTPVNMASDKYFAHLMKVIRRVVFLPYAMSHTVNDVLEFSSVRLSSVAWYYYHLSLVDYYLRLCRNTNLTSQWLKCRFEPRTVSHITEIFVSYGTLDMVAFLMSNVIFPGPCSLVDIN
jgi:hypothetical protein